MTPQQILAIPPKVLTQAQREFYFAEGYLLLERAIDPRSGWSACAPRPTSWSSAAARSRASDAVFDLEPGHTRRRAAAAPGVEPGRAAPGVLGLRLALARSPTSSPTSSARTSSSTTRSSTSSGRTAARK